MDQDQIPEAVLKFISEHIESVPHLEALLLLWREPARSWTVHDIASRIYVADELSAHVLLGLARQQLIRELSSNPAQYQFDTEWDRESKLMPRLADAYQRHLIRVATFIHSRASASVREFARAFDFKKDN